MIDPTTLEANASRPRVGTRAGDFEPTKPMRGELLGVDRLEQLAAGLASAHRVAPPGAKAPGLNLLARLVRNQRRLAAAHRAAAKAVERGQTTTTSSRSSCARRARTCRSATTASCRSSSRASRPARPASTPSPSS